MARRGEIANIKDLLLKYKERLSAPQGAVIHVVQAALQSEMGIELKESQIRYNPATKTVSFTIMGPQKSEILFKKSAVLKYCREALGVKNAPKHLI